MSRRVSMVVGVMALMLSPNLLASQVTYPVDFRLGVSTSGTRRNQSVNDVLGATVSSSLRSVEASLSPADGTGGIGGRIIDGTFAGEKFLLREARVFVGERAFNVIVGYGDRTISGTDSTTAFSRAGIRSIVRIGGSGVLLSVEGSKYFPGDFSRKDEDAPDRTDGWEGQTGLFYATPKIPAYLHFGYRTEYFSFGEHDEHLSGITFGIGVWLGARQ
jgi:hypothetical protein